MEKALRTGADALILDLEDSVTAEKKPEAREAVRAFLKSAGRKVALFVRINPLDSGLADDDLDAVANARPDGIMLPKAEGAASVNDLAGRLAARGSQDARILPIASETARAVFQLGSYSDAADRLAWRSEEGRVGKEG